MDIPLHLHRWVRSPFDRTAAVVAGFTGGAVLMAIELLWSAVAPGAGGPWQTPHLVAALLMGPHVLWATPYVFDPGILVAALFTHYLLGIGFGVLLAGVANGFGFDRDLPAILALGAVFGLALYGMNFHVMVTFFPWFKALQGWPTAVAHVAFGVTAAALYHHLARRPDATRRHE